MLLNSVSMLSKGQQSASHYGGDSMDKCRGAQKQSPKMLNSATTADRDTLPENG